LTRHELKEQLQHDHFRDAVSEAVLYAGAHRQRVIRWLIAVIAILIAAGAAFWYASYRSSVRQRELQSAFSILEIPVAPSNTSGKSFPTEQARRQAAIKAFSDVVAKDGGTREGLTAQYYLGTLKAQNGDTKGAEADLTAVANSSNECAPLAKIALAQLYAGQNRLREAGNLLQEIVNKPTDLVSKAQAQILLAHLDVSTNPQEAKKILQSLRTPNQDPAVSRAADEISSQLSK
jgi:hypothetical protein